MARSRPLNRRRRLNHTIDQIEELPSIARLRRVAQGLALLDAVLSPDWEARYFSFNRRWSPADEREAVASMRDGSGSEYFVHFSPVGVAGKVLQSDAALADAPHHLERVPTEFAAFRSEPAFELQHASAYFWRSSTAAQWSVAPEGRGCYPLLGFLARGLAEYEPWARRYYGRAVDSAALQAVFDELRVTAAQLARLDPSRSLRALQADLEEIVGLGAGA